MKLKLIGLMLAFAASVFSSHLYAEQKSCEDPTPIRFALIPKKNMVEQLRYYQPLLRLLEKNLNRKVEVLQPTSYGTVIEGLLSNSVDIAELGAGSYALTKKRDASAIEAFATYSHTKGHFTEEGKYYRSILIVKSDSPYKSFDALRGATLNLTDPASTSGAIVPQKMFSATVGMPLNIFFERILYSGSHEAAIKLVHKGFSDAAFVASMRLDEEIKAHKFRNNDFKVLWQSNPIPNEPTVYRSNLCEPLKSKIRQVFFNHATELAPMLRNLNLVKLVETNDAEYQAVIQAYE